MFKGVAWLAKLVAAGLIISFLSIWTTGYIVTSYVDSLMRQFQIPIDVPPMAMSGVWGKLWGADPLLTADTIPPPGSEAVDGNVEGDGGSGPDVIEVFGSDEKSGEKTYEEKRDETAGDADLEPKSDDFVSANGEISDEDKSALFQILMAKLPPDLWETIVQYAEDGITDQQLIAIQEMIAQHLSADEYEQLMGILKKY